MREVIIGAVSAFVVAVITITFLGPAKEAPPPPPAQEQLLPPNPNRKMDFSKLRGKDHPFFRKNAAFMRAIDAGTP